MARGAEIQDRKMFAAKHIPVLCEAVYDVSWLLGRGYAKDTAYRMVGNRYQLTARQRQAVRRAGCSKQSLLLRNERLLRVLPSDAQVHIDGFNILITIERALGGAVLLRCVDGVLRDIASVHGSYRAAAQTEQAISLIRKALHELGVLHIDWYLDRPVSNSGKLAVMLRHYGDEVHIVNNPDADLVATEGVVISGDSWVMENARRWFDLSSYIVERYIPSAWVVNLVK